MQTNRISVPQYAFLRDVRDGTVLLEALKEKHGLDGKRFSRWMRGTGFKRAMAEMLRESKRRRYLELQMAANVAAELLARAVRKEIVLTAGDLALCEQVRRAAHQEEQARRAARRARGRGVGGRGRRRPSPDDDLCHPNAKAHENELLAILEADAAQGRRMEGSDGEAAAVDDVGGVAAVAPPVEPASG